MHFLIVKNAYRIKHTPPTPPTTTHEFIGAYFIQILPPGWPGMSQDDSNEVLKSIEK